MAQMFVENSPQHVGAYNKGAFARLENLPLSANPFPFEEGDSTLYSAWRDGWLDEASNFCAKQDSQVAGEA